MEEKRAEESRGTFEFLKDWGDGLTRWTERWIPDALVIVIVLSFVAYIFALIWGFKPEVSAGPRGPTNRFRHGDKVSGASWNLPCRCASS